MNPLKINSIAIKGIGPIRDLHLDFDPHFNIICGANGVGKTTVLDCIAQSFVHQIKVRCNADMDEGKWVLNYDYAEEHCKNIERSTSVKYLYDETKGRSFYKQTDSLIVFKVNRLMSYIKVENISRDPDIDDWQLDTATSGGVAHSQIKNWLISRFLWSKHDDALNDVQKANLSKALECFNQVNPDFAFKSVSPETYDILISTPLGDIEMEQLSSGYIAMLVVLLGIIKEIEYRYKDSKKKPLVKVEDFSGVVILDEMDVHLHPTMQSQIYVALKSLLPKAQVITSTHSPHVIQIARPSEIIPLVRDDVGVHVNPLVNREYGCQGWTVEEVLEDVMNMHDTRTKEYHDLMKAFNEGIDSGNADGAKTAYDKLTKMLHPNSVLREVLKIQMMGVGDDSH